MAERRMFAKTIIDSDAFLDMPLSAQALYFHLSMRADDDGFVNNPKKIQRMVGASDDDCKLLIMKRFILTFESGVIVIKHWKIHNYIQKDRYKPTIYQAEKAMLAEKENKVYTDCIQDVYIMDTQDSIGKSKGSLEENKNINTATTSVADSEFETLWKMYPRKEGKTNALKAYKKARKNSVTFEEIKQGLENYINYCETNKTDRQYIKQGSTWFNQQCWNDEYIVSNNIKKPVKEQNLDFDRQYGTVL